MKNIYSFLFILVFIALFGCSGEDNNHPDAEFVKTLAKPQGVNLLNDDAYEKVLVNDQLIYISENDDWMLITTNLPKGTEDYVKAKKIAKSGQGVGFYVDNISYQGKVLRGRSIYIASDYIVCDNGIFSKHPLSEAKLREIILDEKSSNMFGYGNGITVLLIKANTTLYKKLE